MTVYGYARVSTTGQTLATQKALLKAAGVSRIFSEKVSGIAARRPELERVLDELEAAFEGKAIRDRDVAAGGLMVKIAERGRLCLD
jgi:DNA invertase Pin-like site-specific DNA recombinase